MSRLTDAIVSAAVALGFGQKSDYTAKNVSLLLKQIAVKAQAADSIDMIDARTTAGVLEYFAENYGSEEKEPYDLSVTGTNATIVVKKGNKTMTPGPDKLKNGDKLTITAAAAEGYDLTSLTVNGETFVSGSQYTVNLHNVAIVAVCAENTDAQ